MSKPSQTPLMGGRPLGGQPGGGLRGGPALSPLPPKGKRGGRWLLWLVLVPLMLIGLTYLLGRTVEPMRAKLEQIPGAGSLLFKAKVWPILWNKPVTKPAADAAKPPANATGNTQPAAPATGGASTALDSKLDEAAARLAAAETKEAALKRLDADLKARENALKEQEVRLNKAVIETEALKVQLQGQLRTEQDKVEIVRGMSRSQQAAFFESLTDDEVIRVLKYMSAEEIGKIIGGMNPYRAGRLFDKLPALAQPSTSP
ncbi:MAG TPA: hypothetical protein VNT75_11280 [Symbiobacteriaceae bacterium]|nr:hypothetical protein [Symbiobacteriaceae bacterium]